MSEFKIPPVSTLIGGSWGNFLRTLRGNRIEPMCYPNVFLTGLIIALCTPLRIYENLYFGKRLKEFSHQEDPIFLIGHWRSGTTFLHSVLCKAHDSSYLTTYFSVFPRYIKSKWLFRPFMEVKMPETRPSDNVKLRAEAPQEDEFALSCFTPYSYYNFWLFPERAAEFYEKYVRITDPKIKKNWRDSYIKLLKKANLNIPGKQLIIKNPVNTARIKTLLEIYPGAKFIYLYRNPLTVYQSSLKFFSEVLSTVWFHRIGKEEIDKLILETYRKLISDYERDRGLIPEGNLVEVRFEDFEANPLLVLEKIYNALSLEGFEEDRKNFEPYVESLKGYQKNNYNPSDEIIRKVTENWGFAFEEYGYSIPPEQQVEKQPLSRSN